MTIPAAQSAISVIIPAFNAARHLAETLESVRAQTLQPAEIIVVDNGSTDGTPRIALEYGARCEHEPLRGAGHARNRGIAAARGDYFAILDADDLWTPRKLEWQMAALVADPQCEAAFGLIEHFLSPDLAPEDAAGLHCPEGALPIRFPSLMLIRRASFERVGPFITDVALGELIDWMARAESAGLRHTIVPHVVTRRRIHANNLGRCGRDQRGDYLRLLKLKLDRERAAARTGGPE